MRCGRQPIAAVRATAAEMHPSGGEQAAQAAMVISEVFGGPVPRVRGGQSADDDAGRAPSGNRGATGRAG